MLDELRTYFYTACGDIYLHILKNENDNLLFLNFY